MLVGSNRLNTNFENCRFTVRTTGRAVIANSGNFTNCDMHTKSTGENSFCIDAKTTSLVRIYGGTFYSYTGTAAKIASVFNIESTETNACIFANNLNCPVVAQSGYTQNYYARTLAGMTVINSIITTLNPSGPSNYIVVNDKVIKNKI